MIKIFNDIFKPHTPPFFAKDKVFLTSEIVGTALLVSEAFMKAPENYVIITNNLYNAQKLISTLQTFVNPDDILFYPNDDLLFTEILTATKQLEAQRIFTLYKALEGRKKYIYVANLSAALKPTLLPSYFSNFIKHLKVGDTLTIDRFITHLVEMGYQNVANVEQTMQFATRGDIVDFFSANEDYPVRVEFFDDVIDSIRRFNVSTQVSIAQLDKITILPATESVLRKEEKVELLSQINRFFDESLKGYDENEKELFRLGLDHQVATYLDGDESALSKYLLLHPHFRHDFLSYIKDPKVVFANEPQLHASYELITSQAEHFVHDSVRKHHLLPDLKLYQDYDRLLFYSNFMTKEFSEDGKETELRISPIPSIRSKDDFIYEVKKMAEDGYEIYFSINNNTQLEQVKTLLESAELTYKLEEENCACNIVITYAYFPHGFALNAYKKAIFTSKELFNITRNEMRYNARFKAGSVIRSYEQLTPGDYVVHEYHGIGQYIAIESFLSFGVLKDYIKIKYAGNEELSIPLEQIHLIRKYSGREGVAPKLHKIGGQEWTKTKARINEKINDIADALIEVQAARMKTEGYAFATDDEFQKEFELGFPYELTEDQEIALREIKADMEQPIIMDRLLSGDVGFGKTEIALRAAFKAISSGKQVLFLCPTTLLARQHFEVSKERFANFGVKVAMISRLVSQREKTDIINRYQNGEIHLLIGTHALFSIDFELSNVGLLIVDEEQRFGVEQKEIIKKMKARVDVLTLSATPIPRTLQMSLLGIRGLSQINTAPQERMPIQTYVIKRDEYVIKELIEREISRSGQVFYLYNRIASIYQVANRITKLVSGAKVGVIHGQMDRNEVEDVMNEFYNNELNVLVATSIIENGIDVPNANVIIVENADLFGLSQLYQIKGRVGRGNRIAYAYLLYQPQKIMNDDAKKRLQAIQEFTDLGSGYKIAQRDLMIRGAGDILGSEQSGFIDSVGIDMYLKMLQDTINEKKYNLSSEPVERSINISGLEAYIPDKFASKTDKFDLYLEIKQSKKLTSLKEVEQKVTDMYGKLPKPLQILFLKRQIELMINSKVNYVEDVIDGDTFIDIVPGQAFLNIPGSAVSLSNRIGTIFTNIRFMTSSGKIKVRIIKKGDWFQAYATLVRTIVAIVRDTINNRNETR